MSFRHLVGLLLLVSILLSVGSAMSIRHYSRLPDFYRMELASDRKDVERIRGMLNYSRSQLERAAADFSLQNAYEVNAVLTGRANPRAQLWLPPMLENLSGIVITDADGNTLHDENYQRDRFARNLEDGLAKYLLHSVNFKPTELNPIAVGSGFAATSTGIVQVGVVPVQQVSARDNTLAGYIVAWQKVDSDFFNKISQLSQTQLSFVRELDFGERLTHQKEFQAIFESKDFISPRDEHGHIYWLVPDYDGEPLFFVRQIASPRVFDDDPVDKPILVSLLVLSLCLLMFYWVLGHYTFTPLEKAEHLLNELANNPDDERRLPQLPAKELNSMFGSFNKLLTIILQQRRILQERNDELDELSSLDALTGVKNRRSLDQHLGNSIATAKRIHTTLAVMMIDIDAFKAFNDNYGHQRGDRALTQVAVTLEKSLQRSTDFFARYGGEEFCAVVIGASEAEVRELGERLCLAVAELLIPHEYSQVARHVTVSIGVTVLHHDEHESSLSSTLVHLLDSADSALYEAKRCGRNQVVVRAFDPLPPQPKGLVEQDVKPGKGGNVIPFGER